MPTFEVPQEFSLLILTQTHNALFNSTVAEWRRVEGRGGGGEGEGEGEGRGEGEGEGGGRGRQFTYK